ncbi:hypothetical protein GEMRC1_003649 [Eukaryota sp. GEM-RC1]
MGVTLQKRTSTYRVPKHLLSPGDILIQAAPDGLSTMIQYGTNGTGIGHCAMIVEMNNDIYVIESQDDAPFSDVPPSPTVRRGISATPYDKFFDLLADEKMTVWLPLRVDLRKRFNNTKAVEFFKSREHNPYGYSNFMSSWIDTTDSSYPGYIQWPMLLAGLKLAERFVPDKTEILVLKGASQKLGQNWFKNLDELSQYLTKINMTFGEMWALPEDDDWLYDGRHQLICSSFVVATLKAAGVFDEAVAKGLMATEFTPKDVTQLDIFEKNWSTKPAECGLGDFSGCQIGGIYQAPVEHWPFFNSIKPYAGMNTKCPRLRTPDMIC